MGERTALGVLLRTMCVNRAIGLWRLAVKSLLALTVSWGCCTMYGALDVPEANTVEALAASFEKTHAAFEAECEQARAHIAVKLLSRIRNDSRAIVHKLRESTLAPFIAFKPNSIASADFLQKIEQQLLPALGFCDDPQACTQDYRILQRLARTATELYEHLTVLYRDTVKHALEQIDDAKALQQLLDL
jgi:hypothetical protein